MKIFQWEPSCCQTDGQTNTTKLVVGIWNFTNAPGNLQRQVTFNGPVTGIFRIQLYLVCK